MNVIDSPTMRIVQALLLSLVLMVGSGLAAAKGRSSSNHAAKTKTSKPKASKATAKSGSDVSVRGYTKKNGTHVQPSKRSAPNGTQKDNFSTKGNVNPYTGKKGTKTPKK
jgi:hypothetical protein